MRIVRLGVAVVWVIINISVLSFLFVHREKTGLCTLSYPPTCYNITQYGWPKPWLSMHEDTRSTVYANNVRHIAFMGILFFFPSLLLAFIAGKGLKNAYTRN